MTLEPVFKECRIKWNDAGHTSGWNSAADIEHLLDDPVFECESLGWLVAQDAHRVVIAMSVSRTKAADLLEIPRGCIIDMYLMNEDGKFKP
jgi:hypothetical protein